MNKQNPTRSILIAGIPLVFFVALFSFVPKAQAATITSTATGGIWTAGSTWVGGVVPASGDSAVITTSGGNSVTIGANDTIAGLTVNAGSILSFTGAFILTENGNSVVNGTVNGAT